MLELSQLTRQIQAMSREIAARRRQHADLVALALRWLSEYADLGEQLRRPARAFHAAIPTAEALDHSVPFPPIPDQFTVIAADGSQIQPDRHGAALYHLINVGSIVYRHGSGQAPAAHSRPTLGYTDDDLYENGLLVAGNLLDVRRDLAEITRLADLCADKSAAPQIALVDGTLLLWVLEERSGAQADEWRRAKVLAYLEQLQRIRETGAAVAAFTSRPRRTEVARLLHLAHVSDASGDLREASQKAQQQANPLERLPDGLFFGAHLPPGARSALFISPASVNHDYYRAAGHTIHFFYLNLADEGQPSIVARVEIPAWVAESPAQLALVHGSIVAQARIAGGYPYALARADELAFVGRRERTAFEDMIATALLREGVTTTPSPKAYYKSLTRGGRTGYGRRRRR
jgi:hypothetical protein